MRRINRILKRRTFGEIISSTPIIKSKRFVIHYRPNEENLTKIGISVSKRNGKAVVRNKIKRQIRAIIAKNFDLSKSLDLVIIVRNGYVTDDFHEIEKELVSDVTKIGE